MEKHILYTKLIQVYSKIYPETKTRKKKHYTKDEKGRMQGYMKPVRVLTGALVWDCKVRVAVLVGADTDVLGKALMDGQHRVWKVVERDELVPGSVELTLRNYKTTTDKPRASLRNVPVITLESKDFSQLININPNESRYEAAGTRLV